MFKNLGDVIMNEYVVYCLSDGKKVKIDTAYKYLDAAVLNAEALAKEVGTFIPDAVTINTLTEDGTGNIVINGSKHRNAIIGIAPVRYTEMDMLV